jgi:hypothetical protein
MEAQRQRPIEQARRQTRYKEEKSYFWIKLLWITLQLLNPHSDHSQCFFDRAAIKQAKLLL